MRGHALIRVTFPDPRPAVLCERWFLERLTPACAASCVFRMLSRGAGQVPLGESFTVRVPRGAFAREVMESFARAPSGVFGGAFSTKLEEPNA